MKNYIDNLNWRAAIKQYDESKKLTAEQVELLRESIRLAPSSFGVQPYLVVEVASDDMQAKLAQAGYNQPQFTACDRVYVFAAKKSLSQADVDEFIELNKSARGLEDEQVAGLKDMVSGFVANNPDHLSWSSKQCYTTLGFLLSAAAQNEIDASPMEGFDSAGVDELLELGDYTSVVVAAVGFRSDEDKYSKMPKVRKSNDDLFKLV